jgi:hypothetical protein
MGCTLATRKPEEPISFKPGAQSYVPRIPWATSRIQPLKLPTHFNREAEPETREV